MTREDLFRWKSKRNTGVQVTWHYDKESSPEYKYREKNAHFIRLANILHSNTGHTGVHRTVPEKLWAELGWARYDYLTQLTGEENCAGDNLMNYKQKVKLIDRLFLRFPNQTSNKPMYENEISSETLAQAQEIFYSLTRCPHTYESAKELQFFFYKLKKFSLKTILVTLIRLINTSKKNNKINEMLAARYLLRELFIKNIAFLQTLNLRTSHTTSIAMSFNEIFP